jgi:hypothetical protein
MGLARENAFLSFVFALIFGTSIVDRMLEALRMPERSNKVTAEIPEAFLKEIIDNSLTLADDWG